MALKYTPRVFPERDFKNAFSCIILVLRSAMSAILSSFCESDLDCRPAIAASRAEISLLILSLRALSSPSLAAASASALALSAAMSALRSSFSDFAKLSRLAMAVLRASFSDSAKFLRFAISVLRASFSPFAHPSRLAMSVILAWLSLAVLSSRDLISFFLRSFSLVVVTSKASWSDFSWSWLDLRASISALRSLLVLRRPDRVSLSLVLKSFPASNVAATLASIFLLLFYARKEQLSL